MHVHVHVHVHVRQADFDLRVTAAEELVDQLHHCRLVQHRSRRLVVGSVDEGHARVHEESLHIGGRGALSVLHVMTIDLRGASAGCRVQGAGCAL